MTERFDLCIIGAGPAGLSAAARAAARSLSYVLLERAGHVADTVFCYQKNKPVMAEPSLIPLRSDVNFEAGRREEILEAWQEAVRSQDLNLRTRQEVQSVEPLGDGEPRFRVRTGDAEYEAGRVVLALGTQGNPRKLGSPGEDLPHVSHRLIDPDEHDDEDIVVVGAGDSALEVAIALANANRVHLIVRKPEIVRGKEALEKEIHQLAARGEVTIHYSTTVREIHEDSVELSGAERELRVPAQRVFLMIGANPPKGFLESMGIEVRGSGRDARPVLDDSYQAKGVPGLHLIGSVSGRGDLIKLGMNQGWDVVEHILGHDVEPADEPVLRERLPFWSGSVRERIDVLRREVPLFSGASQAELRELFLATEAREYAPGDILRKQDLHCPHLQIVIDGAVEIFKRPEGVEEERPVATLREGDFVGEMSLISDQPASATVRAQGPVRILEVSRKAVLKLLATSPEARRLVDETFLLRAFETYLFPDVPPETLRELASRATLEERQANEVVVREGAEPMDDSAFYLIRSGMVKVSQEQGDGERVLSYLPAGNFFGETALLENVRRGATVTTIFPTELVRLGRLDFRRFLALYPDLKPRFVDKLEERRTAALVALTDPRGADIQQRLIDEEIVMGKNALVIDDHKCIRCGNCIAACEGVHDDGQSRLTLTGIHFYNLLFPNSCWQCEDPLCMLDCPPDALVRDASGEIHIKSNCIGCGNCEENCPYGNIFLRHPKETTGPFSFLRKLVGMSPKEAERQVAVKCDMTSRPGGPACVLSCPTGAAMRLTREEYEESLAEIVVRQGGG